MLRKSGRRPAIFETDRLMGRHDGIFSKLQTRRKKDGDDDDDHDDGEMKKPLHSSYDHHAPTLFHT